MEHTNRSGAEKRRGKKRFSLLKLIGGFFLTLFTIASIGLLTFYLFFQIFMTYVNTSVIPTVGISIEELTMSEASTIYYADSTSGEWKVLDTLFMSEGNRQIVTYDELPKHLIQAVVAIEDHRFWEHHGVDWEGTAAAFIKTFTTGSTRGGSTITQQFLRNYTEDNDVSVKRKIREIFRALEFEKTTSKEDILTLYLNYVYFGSGCNGIQTAAQKYFGKDVSDLTLAESACIIGITNNPSLYDPFRKAEFTQSDGSIKTPRDFNKERQELILDRMASEDVGYITRAEAEAAKKEFLMFTDTPEYAALHAGDADEEEVESSTSSNVYSWFTDLVINEAIELIREARSCDEKTATQLLFSAGYHIYTTLDMDIQKVVDKVYTDTSNFDYPSKTGQQLNSAITITDPYTGNIVAIAGGVGEKTGSRSLSLATSPRPCGSAIKPVSVYAPAIDKNIISPASVVDDYPVEINEETGTAWPRNSNGKYRGYTTITYGVQWSLNTLSTRVLEMLGTEESFYFMEENLGFDLDIKDNALAPLAMGGLTYGVTTVEMAAAFASFANEGIYNEPRCVTKIVGNDGRTIIAENNVSSRVAMKETTAYLMNRMLRNVVTGGTGGSANFDGMTIAGKTGTTSNNFDRYFVGYTPYYSAAVWVGYSESNEKVNAGSKNPAALVWKQIMQEIHQNLENKSFFEKPAGITTVTVCADCGLLATDNCRNEARGDRTYTTEIQAEAAPTEECTCHIPVRVCYNAETGECNLAGEYCPDETCFDQIWLAGREFMVLSTTPVTLEDGTVVDSVEYVLSTDADFHLTYRQTLPTCPYHTSAEPEPELPDEEEPLVPGDEGWTWPDWWQWGQPGDAGSYPSGGDSTPDEPDETPDDTPGENGNGDSASNSDGWGAPPDEPDEPDEPSLPDEL